MAGGGLHRHAHDALVASGLPHGLRRASVHEGQQAGEGGGRPPERRGERQAVHALSVHAGSREPSRPPEVPPAPHGRARRRPVGAHLLGRGVRRDHRKGAQDQGGTRLRVHRRRAWHGPQHRMAGALLRLRLHGDAQRVHVRLHRLRLLPAPHDRHVRQVRRHVHRRRVAGPSGTLRRRGLGSAGRRAGVGQRAHQVQRRRLLGPLAGAVRADGQQDRLGRPAPDLVGRACRLLAAGTSGHRRRGGHGHAQRHHRRGPVRPRVRGVLDLRLRGAGRTRGRQDARMGL